MKDYFCLGPVPYSENCCQVGSENFVYNSTKECTAFINQLKRTLLYSKKYNSFEIKWNNHDFGMYPEVIINFDDENKDSVKFALAVERNCPEFWDEIAKKELGIID